jgi:hypothetical protein
VNPGRAVDLDPVGTVVVDPGGTVVLGPSGAVVEAMSELMLLSLMKLLLWARGATVAVGLGLACCKPGKSCIWNFREINI